MSEILPFKQRLSSALANPDISTGLADFQQRWRTNRDNHIHTLEQRSDTNFAQLAKQIAQAKQHARRHPEVLQSFCDNASARGARIHHAADARAACRIISQICQDSGARLAVKTKSMATEEISLNRHLEADGIAVVETDLGEWLLQCAGDRPSHLIVPAIHKRRHDIAELLGRIYDRAFDPDDILTMARVVRSELRPHFLGAGVGITGANVLVGETGSVVLVTNEGNAGLTVALPGVQVVLAGWDKLVETTRDALNIVQLLAKSATGQVISSYTQFISGPIADAADSVSGVATSTEAPAQQLHIVLLDNGRSAMAADPEFESALSCIRCGACSNVCPPYQVVGGHAFGHVYTGAIGLVTAGFHHGWPAAQGPQSLCVSCGACARVCPADIELPQQILAVRAKVHPRNVGVWLRTGMRILRSRRLVAAALLVAKAATVVFESGGTLRRLPLPRKFRWRTAPAIPLRPARRHRELRAVSASKTGHGKTGHGKTALFLQCLSDRLVPGIPLASLRLLHACGADVVMPTSQHCCGLPAFDLGDLKSARKMAADTLDALEGYDCVVTPAISCAIAISHDYPKLFADDPRQLARAQDLAQRTTDLVSYLNEHLPASMPGSSPGTPGDPPGTTAGPALTVHQFCQNNVAGSASANNPMRSNNPMAQLIEKTCGKQPAPLPESDVCCGFGGSTSLSNPQVAKAILDRKLKNVSKTQADVLVTDNPGCVLHIRGAAQAQKSPFKVLHIAEFLEQYL